MFEDYDRLAMLAFDKETNRDLRKTLDKTHRIR